MNLDHFGMDTITLAGSLEGRLAAIRDAGFTQVMLNAGDIVAMPPARRPPSTRCAGAACA